MCVCVYVCVCILKEIELYVLRFEVFVTVECIEVILSDRICQCGMYRGIIVLQLVSVQYLKGHYCTSVGVSTVFKRALLYCSWCQYSI